MTEYPILRERLSAVYRLVRRGSVAVDVGTDHAYLPIALCLDGVCPRVIASDVRDGPVERAREDVLHYGLEDRVRVVKTDGLSGLDVYAPDDILIAGMGGELIVRILSDAPWIRKTGIRLVLQPMTRQQEVRKYLLENGFAILREAIAEDDGGRIYQILSAEYDGEKRVLTDSIEEMLDLALGKENMGQDGALYRKQLLRYREIYRRRIDGKREAQAQNAETVGNALREDLRMQEEIEHRLNRTERIGSDEG